MPTIKLPSGETVEVALDAVTFSEGEVPQGFVTTDHLAAEVKRRVGSAKRSARTDLLQDDEFWREAATARGVELREDGLPKGSSKDDAAAFERWKAQHLTPVQTKLKETEMAVERYRRRAMEADVLQAAAEMGIKESFLKPVAAGTPAPIVTLLKDALIHDAETDSWALRTEDGQIRYGADGKPAGARTLLEEMKGNDAFEAYFKPTKMNGPGHSGNPGNPGGRIYTTAEIAAMDMATFEKLESDISAAQREGRIRD